MFAYCNNSPVRRSDPTGTWFGEDVLDWLEDTFGLAVYETNTYEAMTVENVFGDGGEFGEATSGVIAGNNNKPVVFYVQKAGTWWHFWEYGVGVTYNSESGDSFSVTSQATGGSVSWSRGNMATEIGVSFEKISYTVFSNFNYKDRTASAYAQMYIRPRTIITAAAVAVIAAGCVGAAAAAVAGAVMAFA